jgi:hypothetical protein
MSKKPPKAAAIPKVPVVVPHAPKEQREFLSAERQTKILWAVLILYVVLVFYGISNHELWRDEGADWMAARDLGFIDLLKWYVPQGGHPPLYYLVLFPLAKMGFPLKTVNIISLGFMSASVYTLLFRIRFPLFFKLTLVFSYFFLFEYGVIGRNYGVVVFFLFSLIRFYSCRFEKPWIYALILVCLLNSDSLLFPFSMAVVFMYWLELWQQKKLRAEYLLPALFMMVGGLYIIPYMAIPGMSSQAAVVKIPDHLEEIVKTIEGAFVLYNDGLVALLAFIAVLVLLAARPKALFLLLCGAASLLYLLGYVHAGDMRHRGLLLMEIIAAYGIGLAYGDDTGGSLKRLADQGKKMIQAGFVILSAFLVYQTYAGVQIWKRDIDSNFSGSRDAAGFLLDNHLEHKIIIGQPSWAASSVMQYLPRDCRMYYADCQRYGSFIIYDSLYEANQFRFVPDYGAYTAEHKFADSLDRVVLLLNSPLRKKKYAEHWNLVYYTKDEPMKKQESYFIYELRKPYGGRPVSAD